MVICGFPEKHGGAHLMTQCQFPKHIGILIKQLRGTNSAVCFAFLDRSDDSCKLRPTYQTTRLPLTLAVIAEGAKINVARADLRCGVVLIFDLTQC